VEAVLKPCQGVPEPGSDTSGAPFAGSPKRPFHLRKQGGTGARRPTVGVVVSAGGPVLEAGRPVEGGVRQLLQEQGGLARGVRRRVDDPFGDGDRERGQRGQFPGEPQGGLQVRSLAGDLGEQAPAERLLGRQP
jgi:hypothetical protein